MPLTPITAVISLVLFLVLGFGIGFILNMLLRSTWLPLVLGVGIVAYVVISLLMNGKVPQLIDIVILSAGIAGTVGSGYTIQLLRKKGYRMF
ncbi:YuiB family protein [Brevibacillus daliensis]|uniref:YuiB family protein n=1 Tax=Brevibacillus daliensis TaxID=2892995 RepID=UPI001E28684F|nr:YuiB family protein [Brevibacillus daliensis]